MKYGTNIQTGGEFRVWVDDQCHELHLKSLEILDRVGIIVHDADALEIYRKGGAFIRDNRAFIPAWMVDEALRTAPERIVLRRPNKTLFLEENIINYGLGTEMPFFQDFITGENRRSVLKDVEDVSRVADGLSDIDFIACMAIANDRNIKIADLYHFRAMMENSDKPILMTASDKDNLQGIIDMAAAAAGGYKELERNPRFLFYTEPISPLVNSKEALQKLMLCAKYSIPVTYASGITSGATGPITLAGNLALGNAEGLAGLVLHQLVNPGAPFLYGIVAAPMDMATMICKYGGPEIPLYFCAVGQMGRYYKLPSFGQSGNTDSVVLDQQASIDAMFSIFVAGLSGTNFVHDNGYIGNGLIGSLEMIALCDEFISIVKSFMEGFKIVPERLCLDDIKQIGPLGRYSGRRSRENWEGKFFAAKSFLEKEDELNLFKGKVREKVAGILENHHPKPVSAHMSEEFTRIINEHEKRTLTLHN